MSAIAVHSAAAYGDYQRSALFPTNGMHCHVKPSGELEQSVHSQVLSLGHSYRSNIISIPNFTNAIFNIINT